MYICFSTLNFLNINLKIFYNKFLNLVFWIEPVQKDIYSDIAAALKEIDNLHLETVISDAVLVIESEPDDELNDEDVNNRNMKTCK